MPGGGPGSASCRRGRRRSGTDGKGGRVSRQAEKRCTEAYAWQESHNGKSDWRTIDAKIALLDVQLLRKMTVAQIRKYVQWDKAQAEAARLYEEAHYGEALRAAQGALKLCRESVGEQHPRFATSLSTIARAHRGMGEEATSTPAVPAGA